MKKPNKNSHKWDEKAYRSRGLKVPEHLQSKKAESAHKQEESKEYAEQSSYKSANHESEKSDPTGQMPWNDLIRKHFGMGQYHKPTVNEQLVKIGEQNVALCKAVNTLAAKVHRVTGKANRLEILMPDERPNTVSAWLNAISENIDDINRCVEANTKILAEAIG